MAREDVPAIAMGVDRQARALAQEGHAAEADRVDVDDGRVAAGLGDDVVVAQHRLRIGMRNAEGVHQRLRPCRCSPSRMTGMTAFDPVGEARIGRAHQLLVVLDEVDAGLDELPHHGRRSRAGRRPSAGLTIVPMIGRPSTPVSAAAAGDAELRTRMGAAEGLRQRHPDDADAAQPADRDRRRRWRSSSDGREIGADGVERKGDGRVGAVERPGLAIGRNRRHGERRERPRSRRRAPRREP